jgi:pilus assembly protein CpaF
MTDIQIVHKDIMTYLEQNNIVDLSTLPSDGEKEDFQTQVKKRLENNYSNIAPELKARIHAEFFSSGPIENLIADSEITEIIINGPKTIWFEKRGQMHAHDDHFLSITSYQNFVQRLTLESKIQANLDRPFADGYWRQYRVHIIIPPLAQGEAHLSLRRHPNNSWSLPRLEEVRWASPDALLYLKNMVKNHMSFLIVGATGTGKTSVLSACLQEVESSERIIIIEDTNELHLPNPLSAKLVARHDPQGLLKDIDQSELLRQALRMRPDRIIMGEVRGAEAKDLLMTLSTGHRGGIGTLHADSARQALYRLEMLIQMGAPQWSTKAIRHLIYFGLQAVVCVKRENGVRKLDSIHKIVSLEETGFCLEQVS